MNSVVLQTATRALVALLLMFSVYMLIRGHNQPGGGFIAGLIAAAAFTLFALAWGATAARSALRVQPGTLAALGVLLAGASAMVAGLAGEPLFTGQWLFLGGADGDKKVALSSVLVFDIGIYLAVLGAALVLIFALEEKS
ncbi:Na+/H+ antiporter subunit B [Microbulbifer discodermiae]|uniref:Na+/H+ antiporter subunit B n=1 Tax=Microbulbifer sp. 2201CG32-9 TaxID=3232309 RepID=UPI00345C0F0D